MSLEIEVFFFKQKTAYEMRISDWSSDVCSSDLKPARRGLIATGNVPARDHFGVCSRCGLIFFPFGNTPLEIDAHFVHQLVQLEYLVAPALGGRQQPGLIGRDVDLFELLVHSASVGLRPGDDHPAVLVLGSVEDHRNLSSSTSCRR